ncbi:MAG: hypothetical protein HQ515_13585, partial [Phycisphaeraceae bacterium]|nr:hypothetical protein [Phycisphaeraceae bacterium]
MQKSIHLWILVLSWVLSASTRADVSNPGPVKVFILAGQSNMVGDGHVEPADKRGTLAYMVEKSDRAEQFKHLVDEDGDWRTRKDVWYFQRQTVKKGQAVETVD